MMINREHQKNIINRLTAGGLLSKSILSKMQSPYVDDIDSWLSLDDALLETFIEATDTKSNEVGGLMYMLSFFSPDHMLRHAGSIYDLGLAAGVFKHHVERTVDRELFVNTIIYYMNIGGSLGIPMIEYSRHLADTGDDYYPYVFKKILSSSSVGRDDIINEDVSVFSGYPEDKHQDIVAPVLYEFLALGDNEKLFFMNDDGSIRSNHLYGFLESLEELTDPELRDRFFKLKDIAALTNIKRRITLNGGNKAFKSLINDIPLGVLSSLGSDSIRDIARVATYSEHFSLDIIIGTERDPRKALFKILRDRNLEMSISGRGSRPIIIGGSLNPSMIHAVMGLKRKIEVQVEDLQLDKLNFMDELDDYIELNRRFDQRYLLDTMLDPRFSALARDLDVYDVKMLFSLVNKFASSDYIMESLAKKTDFVFIGFEDMMSRGVYSRISVAGIALSKLYGIDFKCVHDLISECRDPFEVYAAINLYKDGLLSKDLQHPSSGSLSLRASLLGLEKIGDNIFAMDDGALVADNISLSRGCPPVYNEDYPFSLDLFGVSPATHSMAKEMMLSGFVTDITSDINVEDIVFNKYKRFKKGELFLSDKFVDIEGGYSIFQAGFINLFYNLLYLGFTISKDNQDKIIDGFISDDKDVIEGILGKVELK